MPKDKFKDNTELLIANSVDEVANGVVPAWVVNTTDMDVEINRFESLAKVAEYEILGSGNDDEVEEGKEFFQNTGFTLPTVDNPPMIYPRPARIRDMLCEEGQLLLDILKKVQDEEDITEPILELDLMDSELTVVQRKSNVMIIHQFTDIFAKDDEDLGRTHWVKHAIDTGDAVPITNRAYHAPLTLRKALEDTIQAMERQGVVRKSNSPW